MPAYKIIDLSLPLKTSVQEFIPPRIKFISHKKGARLLGLAGAVSQKSRLSTLYNLILFFVGIRKIGYKDFPGQAGLAWEELTLSTHTGTHLDAPWHFGETSEGKPAKTIDAIPLEWCYGNGVVLDLRHKKAGEAIGADDIQRACEKIHYQIKPADIVMIMTGADKFSVDKKYLFAYPGVSAEAVVWLVKKGVKVIGTDTWGFDRPSQDMVRDYLKTKDSKYLWPAHIVGRDKEYCHIEKLANLDKIPVPFGFTVACFPINIEGSSAGWARVVAIVSEK